MNFLSKHGEKLLLVLLLVGLAVSVVLGIASLTGLENPATLKLKAPESNVELDVSVLDTLIDRLSGNPPQLALETGSFTPEIRVKSINPDFPILIPADAETCPHTGYEQTIKDIDTDEGGVFDSVERQLGMDINDPSDDIGDLDGDEFSTLMEQTMGTDPADASSFPDRIQFVRLQTIVETSIVFELRGQARFGDAYTLQIFWKYPDEDRGTVDYIKTGRRFGRNNEFQAVSFTEKSSFVDGKFNDQSFAIIRSGQDEVRLGVKQDNRRGAITEVSAIIGTIFGPSWEQEVRIGDRFGLGTLSYMIVDIQQDAVVVQPDGESDTSPEQVVIKKPTMEDERALKKFESAPVGTSKEEPEPVAPPSFNDLPF